jgi:hypothetical protein
MEPFAACSLARRGVASHLTRVAGDRAPRRFFVAANAVVCTYLVLSIPLSIVHIVRPRARYSRLVLVFFDAVISQVDHTIGLRTRVVSTN